MKNILIWASVFLGITAFAGAPPIDKEKQYLRFNTYVLNGGAENGTSGWAASGGAFSASTSAGEFRTGSRGFSFDASAASQTVTSATNTVPAGNNVARCYFKTTATDYKFQVYNGSSVIAETTIPSSSVFQKLDLNFVLTAAGDAQIRVISASNAAAIFFDDCLVGEADNLGDIAAIIDWNGSTPWTPTGSWSTNTTYTGEWKQVGDDIYYRIYLTTSGAPTSASLTINLPSGHVVDTAKLPGYTTANMPIGFGTIRDEGVDSYDARVRYNDTTSVGISVMGTAGTYGSFASVTQAVPMTWGNTDKLAVIWHLPIVGFSAKQVFRPDTIALSWSGFHQADCSWARTNTSQGDPTADATCTFGERQNTNFGTVTSALSGSDKLPGIVFTPKRAGKFLVCYSASASGGTDNSAYRLILTDGATTITDLEQKTLVANREYLTTSCGIFNATDTSSKTIKLQTMVSTGSVTIAQSYAGYAIEWSIFAIDQQMPAPLLVNSVVSPYSGVARMIWANVNTCNSSGSALDSNSGEVSISNGAGTGRCTLTFSPAFSDVPSCTCATTPGSNTGWCYTGTAAAGSMEFYSFNSSGAAIAGGLRVICVGKK